MYGYADAALGSTLSICWINSSVGVVPAFGWSPRRPALGPGAPADSPASGRIVNSAGTVSGVRK
jgi:hypothetical protein